MLRVFYAKGVLKESASGGPCKAVGPEDPLPAPVGDLTAQQANQP